MIKVYTGPMYSGKSTVIIDSYMNVWNKEETLCFKPEIDNRDQSVIKSRNIEKVIKAIAINNLDEIKPYLTKKVKTIFIDEVQFLKGDVNLLLELSLTKGINFYIAGLNMTSEQILFGIMPQILAIADEIKIFKANCYLCHKPASYTCYNGEKEVDVLVGNEGYIPLCGECLLKKRKREVAKVEILN